MAAFLFALMLGTMLLGIPIVLSIAFVGYVGIAAVVASMVFAGINSSKRPSPPPWFPA